MGNENALNLNFPKPALRKGEWRFTFPCKHEIVINLPEGDYDIDEPISCPKCNEGGLRIYKKTNNGWEEYVYNSK